MIAQVVIFTLKTPELRQEFLALTERMAAWLYQQPGFVSYDLIEGDNTWSDRLVWQSQEDEQRGRTAFLHTPLAASMLECIAADFRSITGVVTVIGK